MALGFQKLHLWGTWEGEGDHLENEVGGSSAVLLGLHGTHTLLPDEEWSSNLQNQKGNNNNNKGNINRAFPILAGI